MFNKAILIGRLTADPELKQTGTGIHFSGFSIAVDRRFSGKDAEKKADFINISAWRQQAEFVCKYFHKGDAIGIEGAIQTRNYEDKTGAKRTAVEVQAENVFFVGGKASGGASSGGGQPSMATSSPVAFSSGATSDFEEIETDDDLPF